MNNIISTLGNLKKGTIHTLYASKVVTTKDGEQVKKDYRMQFQAHINYAAIAEVKERLANGETLKPTWYENIIEGGVKIAKHKSNGKLYLACRPMPKNRKSTWYRGNVEVKPSKLNLFAKDNPEKRKGASQKWATIPLQDIVKIV